LKRIFQPKYAPWNFTPICTVQVVHVQNKPLVVDFIMNNTNAFLLILRNSMTSKIQIFVMSSSFYLLPPETNNSNRPENISFIFVFWLVNLHSFHPEQRIWVQLTFEIERTYSARIGIIWIRSWFFVDQTIIYFEFMNSHFRKILSSRFRNKLSYRYFSPYLGGIAPSKPLSEIHAVYQQFLIQYFMFWVCPKFQIFGSRF
jgi:hypothetical protein